MNKCMNECMIGWVVGRVNECMGEWMNKGIKFALLWNIGALHSVQWDLDVESCFSCNILMTSTVFLKFVFALFCKQCVNGSKGLPW